MRSLSRALLHLINRLEGYGFDTLRHYSKLFPHEALARLIQAYLVYLGIPLTDDDDETTTAPSSSLDDVFSVISVRFRFIHIPQHLTRLHEQETAFALETSIIARRVMSEVYLLDQDYQTTISVSEAGLELVNRYRDNTGSDLTLYVTLQLKDVSNVTQCSNIV